MIADESLKMLAEAIDKRVVETGFSPYIPWFHKDKGYPTVGINKKKKNHAVVSTGSVKSLIK